MDNNDENNEYTEALPKVVFLPGANNRKLNQMVVAVAMLQRSNKLDIPVFPSKTSTATVKEIGLDKTCTQLAADIDLPKIPAAVANAVVPEMELSEIATDPVVSVNETPENDIDEDIIAPPENSHSSAQTTLEPKDIPTDSVVPHNHYPNVPTEMYVRYLRLRDAFQRWQTTDYCAPYDEYLYIFVGSVIGFGLLFLLGFLMYKSASCSVANSMHLARVNQLQKEKLAVLKFLNLFKNLHPKIFEMMTQAQFNNIKSLMES